MTTTQQIAGSFGFGLLAILMLFYLREFLRAKSKRTPEQQIVDALNELRAGAGHSVTFCNDNENSGDLNDAPFCLVLISADWTDWNERDYRGATLLECLNNALIDKRAWERKACIEGHDRKVAMLKNIEKAFGE